MLEQTQHFCDWLQKLDDASLKGYIAAKLELAATNGIYGSTTNVGNNFFRLNMPYWNYGCFIYFAVKGKKIRLLFGNDLKLETKNDLARAITQTKNGIKMKKGARKKLGTKKTSLKVKKFNSAKFLDSDEAISGYLNCAVETGDADFIAHCTSNAIKAQKKRTGTFSVDANKLTEAILVSTPFIDTSKEHTETTAQQVAQYLLAQDAGMKVFAPGNKYIEINNKVCREGCVRLNCYLHTAQNLYIAMHGVKLFEDNLYASETGGVVQSIVLNYEILRMNDTTKKLPKLKRKKQMFLDRLMEIYDYAPVEELVNISQEDPEWEEKHIQPCAKRQMNSIKNAKEYKEKYEDAIYVFNHPNFGCD